MEMLAVEEPVTLRSDDIAGVALEILAAMFNNSAEQIDAFAAARRLA